MMGAVTVLLVEDDAEARYALERVLCSRGHAVIAARDAQEALRKTRLVGARPSVIVFDVNSPVEWDLFDIAKSGEPLLQDVPVILARYQRLTSVPRMVRAVLSPPIKVKELLEAIDACLSVPIGADEPAAPAVDARTSTRPPSEPPAD